MGPEETKTSLYLRQWHQGDHLGLDALLDRHIDWIRDHVRRRLGPALRCKGETGDYVQEALIGFLEYGPRIQISDDTRFRALMGRIVENVLRDKHDWFTARRRAISRERPLLRDTVLNLDPHHKPVDSPSQAVLRHEQEAWVRLGLEVLDPEERNLIVLRDWEELTFARMGERLGLSLDAARRRYNRAMDHLTETVWALKGKNLDDALEGGS